MPTAAKLVSALFFAGLGWICATIYFPLLPEGTRPGVFHEGSAVIGGLCGWFLAGRLAGRGFDRALNIGLTTTAAMVFWVMLYFSIVRMVDMAFKKRYDGPVEAVVGIFDEAIEYGTYMGHTPLLVALAAGAVVGGVLAEAVARRWS
jgi:hypothetical protein